jgi:hypothetical protein
MLPPRLPVLDHLHTLTDDTGIIQHATYDIPNRSTGYCTDDVARGFVVAVAATAHDSLEADATRLGTIYLAFLHDAQLLDGFFHNFLGYDRRWQDLAGGGDAFGRAIWALGYGMRYATRESWRRVCALLLARALPHIESLEAVHSQAYAAIGLSFALESGLADAASARLVLAHLVQLLQSRYVATATPQWHWLEERMTYDNGRICEGILRGGKTLGDEAATTSGIAMLRFYEGIAMEDGVFVPIGNDGWYPRGGTRARFGQQPLEAAAVIDAGLYAYGLTGEPQFRAFADAGMSWFLGRNTASAILVRDGGCCDGIDVHGPSANMGAESTLAYLAGSLASVPPVAAKRSISTLR